MSNTAAPAALALVLGERLKQARLNSDFTQEQVAERAGLTRKTVLNAEKGQVKLEHLLAIMQALDLLEHFNQWLPEQPISPIQLVKLKGKTRQRASGRSSSKNSVRNSNDKGVDW